MFLIWEAWKQSRPPMATILPRYRKSPPVEEMPSQPARPDLRICTISEGKLVVPRDVRQSFLSCPIWGPEWRDFLKTFDRDWGVAIPMASPQKSSSVSEGGSPPPGGVKEEDAKMEADALAFWATQYPDDVKTLDALTAKYGQDVTEMAGPEKGTSLILTPGPQLYLTAKESAITLHMSRVAPVISHGAGTWLLGPKADKFRQDNPTKGIPCIWKTDEIPVLVEATA